MNGLIIAFDTLNIGLSSIVLLLIKLTLLLAFLLVVYRICVKRSASFRHATLGFSLLAVPALVVCHFVAPAWSVPGLELAWLDQWAVGAESNEISSAIGLERGTVKPDSDREIPDNQFADENGSAPGGAWVTDGSLSQGWISNSLKECQLVDSFLDAQSVSTDLSEADPLAALSCLSEPAQSVVMPGPGVFVSRVVWLWIAIVGLMLVRLLLAWMVVLHRVIVAETLQTDSASGLGNCDGVLKQLTRQSVRLKVSKSDDQMPMGIGLWRNTILLPATCTGWNEGKWRSVLLHEQAHFVRRDGWINLAMRIQQAVLWFHPLVWLMTKRIRMESELACDNRVIRSGVARIDYAEVLFQVASRGRCSTSVSLASVTMSDSMALESRLKSILGDHTRREPVDVRSLTGLLALVCMVIAPLSTIQRFEAPLIETPVFGHAVATESRLVVPVVGEQEIAEEELQPFYNVTLKATGDEVTYGDEFVGNCEDVLEISNSKGDLKVSFEQVNSIRKAKDGAYQIEKTDGSTVIGKITNPWLQFTLDADHVMDGEMTREIKPDEIGFAVLISSAGLQAGNITDGVAKSKLSYHLRAPIDFDSEKRYPAIVLLHENNRCSKAYIETVVAKWPEIAERYILVGLNGEVVSSRFDKKNPAYRYTGLSYVGRGSNFRGFPGTQRESPAPIAEAIIELKDRFNFSSTFLAGHGAGGYTSGGNNAYHIHCYFPEVVDGVAVLAGASLVQCNIVEFDDEEIRKLQRETPLVIVEDSVAEEHRYADWSYSKYLDSSFPMLTYLREGAGNKFEELAFDKAIVWLEQMSTNDPEEALQLAEKFFREKNIRDAIVLANRFAATAPVDTPRELVQRGDTGLRSIKYLALPANRYNELLEKVREEKRAGDWYGEFLEFRKKYEFAHGAEKCMATYNRLREDQNAEARLLLKEGQKLDREGGATPVESASGKYREIVHDYFASKYYLLAKSIVDARDKK